MFPRVGEIATTRGIWDSVIGALVSSIELSVVFLGLHAKSQLSKKGVFYSAGF